jgi:hypothetical protein
MLRGADRDLGIDGRSVEHLRGDQFARQFGGVGVSFLFSQVTLQDGIRGALAEVGFEDRRQGEPAAGSTAPDPVSPRRHRPES